MFDCMYMATTYTPDMSLQIIIFFDEVIDTYWYTFGQDILFVHLSFLMQYIGQFIGERNNLGKTS